MDINTMLKGIDCQCGRHHKCNIDSVYIENGAIAHLEEICKTYANILIVADENTFGAAGTKVEDALCGKNIRKVIFTGSGVLIPNEDAIAEVTKQMDGINAIVGIGSGVIQDLCKYVSFFEKVPYVIVATAPSMDGYASDGAAMILKGMKETVPAGLPVAIVADTSVLKDAPMDMIKAGYGDIIGKYSALCDWKLSHELKGEYFCDYICSTTYQMIDNTLNTADGLLKRDENSVKALMEALVVVGIMMSFAGTSRPASGSEHHLSHFFEIVGIVNSEEYLPHGIDVAYSTVVTAKIREEIVKKDFPDVLYRLPREEYTALMESIYKSVAMGCIALQDKVGNYSSLTAEDYKAKETAVKEILSGMPSSNEIIEMLQRVELDMKGFYNTYTEKKISDAIAYAKDLKDRYTVLWLNYDLFGNDC